MRITGGSHPPRYGAGNKELDMRRGQLHSLMGLIAVASLCGCAATRLPVTPVSDNAFHVRSTGARYETQADTNVKALAAANEYCGTQGKQLMFRQSTETAEHAWSPKAEDLTFVCIDAKDPGPMNAANRRDSAVIAQQ
jgi:putative hemolysin